MVRTRLAASPTGYPHIGTIYQALFNYAFAKKHKGRFILRIEDTDRNRFVEGSEEVIFDSLKWFGLTADEGPLSGGEYNPYRQSERLEIYHKYAAELLEKGYAFYSYFPKKDAGQKKIYTSEKNQKSTDLTDQDRPASLKEMIERGDWVVRLKVPKNEKITFKDEIRGEITFDTSEVTEQVLIKSDGFPTYHLAVVVDDQLMKISHIVRAEEWLSSTPKHVLLYRYFNWEMPPIYHTATLRNPDKSKLSKRHGHTSVLWFKEQGFLPVAILNFLALLGWSHPEEKEIFSLDEFIKLFDLKDIRPVAPIFDLVKLRWMNQQYIQNSTDEELEKLILDFNPNAAKLPEETLRNLIPLLKSRMETLSDFEPLTEMFFDKFEVVEFDDTEKSIIPELVTGFRTVKEWSHENIFKVIKEIMLHQKVRMPVFYKLMTGRTRGLPLPEALEIYSKEKSLKRLEKINKL
ncbi:MAG TPA: glutamate--tRNA ligase [Candidatus Limnocylindrales bacterium]|nr:glutamate--tRNA ligase [Candidatus Limnocylindrales bacterium]